MSRKGNSWDNAVAESFFKTIKVERVYQTTYLTRNEAKMDLFQYIEGWYNTRRIHSSNKQKSIWQVLEVLEMDIKFVWIEEFKRHAYVLTVIDTFTRAVLHGYVSYSIKKSDVKKVWEHIIINHLQPNECLGKNIQIEVRNDNDSRFSARQIQAYFKENHLNQIFTHPYTPQENGHIESFHAILSQKLKQYRFWSIQELELIIILFYDNYNNKRLHSSICNLPPNIFIECWNKNLIEMKRDEKKRTIHFKLLIPYHQISDNTSLKCSSSQDCVIPPPKADEQNLNYQKMTSAGTSPKLRHKTSPSFVPRIAKV